MTAMNNHLAGTISDQAIRSFLLGQLNREAQDGFEYCLLTDSDLEARVRLAEYEISDDYARGRLSESERTAFRAKFLLTSERKRKLEVSEALNDRFAPGSLAQSRVPLAQILRNLFDLKQPAWKYAFTALILIVIFATALLVTKESRVVRDIITRISHRKITPKTAPEPAHHSTAPTSPSHPDPNPPLAIHDPRIIDVSLSAKTSWEQSPNLSFPDSQITAARFQLALENGNDASYRAELSTLDGRSIFTADALKASGLNPSAVYFEVSRQLLPAGNYQIKLTGMNGPVNTYYFRVQ